ncbi:M10 family metallopeptidase C-terminal domain-containing protein [Vulcanococcus sp. Clear-D1]|uniref:M10 family metallopeptidase C-terminal domain-containing protein n=1 Tax=Vulcanococcus sp. Clear-D1 TaxID=2766970 RepID=UPI0025E5E835|nr:M10 family metallopeptidase C-terminal domain-containing protein [Vulcanococcus sp. Clear-D1]
MTTITLEQGGLFTNGNNPWIDGITYNAKWGSSSLIPVDVEIAILQPGDAARFDLNSLAWYAAKAVGQEWIQDGNPIGRVRRPARQAIKQGYQAWTDVADIHFRFIEDPTQSDVFVTLAKYKNNGVIPGWGTLGGSHSGLLIDRVISEASFALNESLGEAEEIGSAPAPSPTPLPHDLNHSIFRNLGPDDARFMQTIIHEVGHGIGMSHPHDEGLGSVPSGVFPGIQAGDSAANNGTGLYGLNQNVYTIMSYNRTVQSGGDPDIVPAVTPMALELLAAQIKYGANRATRAGNDVYSLYEQTQPGHKSWACIWDAGGIDTLSAKGLDVDAVISLRPAEMNTAQPETGMPQEQYSWGAAWSPFKVALDYLVNAASSRPGALLGSGMKMHYQLNTFLSELDGMGRAEGQDLESEFKSTLASLEESLTRLYGAYGFNGAYQLLQKGEALPNDASPRLARALAQAQAALRQLTDDYEPLLDDITTFLAEGAFNTITLVDYYQGLNQVVELQSEIQTRSAKGVAGYISEISRSEISSLPIAERPGGGFTIAAGVTIEQAIGGSGDDRIVGNATNNVLRGMKGDDLISPYLGSNRILGGAGIDTVDFNTGIGRIRFKDLSFEQDGNWLKVAMAGSDDLNALKGVEQIIVGNKTYTVDTLLSV